MSRDFSVHKPIPKYGTTLKGTCWYMVRVYRAIWIQMINNNMINYRRSTKPTVVVISSNVAKSYRRHALPLTTTKHIFFVCLFLRNA